MATLSLEEKKKTYLRVAAYLGGLTAIELVFVYSPLPSTIQTILICIASLLKAVCVGWWYMHLNHETKSLKALAILPFLIAFFYATYLVVDAKYTWNRGIVNYMNQPPRVFKGSAHHDSAAPQEHEAAPSEEHKSDGANPPKETPKTEGAEADEWS